MEWRIAKALVASLLVPTSLTAQTAPVPGVGIVRGTFIAVQVGDLPAVADWYRSVFDLAEVNRIETRDGRHAIRILEGPGLTVELIRQRGAVAPESTHLGLFKAGFHVENLDALRHRLEAMGADVDERTFFDEALRARSFVFRDPEGNRLQAFGR